MPPVHKVQEQLHEKKVDECEKLTDYIALLFDN